MWAFPFRSGFTLQSFVLYLRFTSQTQIQHKRIFTAIPNAGVGKENFFVNLLLQSQNNRLFLHTF